MPRASKFTDEQKFEIALDLISGKLPHAEICRKYDISSTYAYKLKDRALDLLRDGIGRPAGKGDAEVRTLAKRVADLEQLAGDDRPVDRTGAAADGAVARSARPRRPRVAAAGAGVGPRAASSDVRVSPHLGDGDRVLHA